jgi:outer membrane protein assembly factor BamB
MRLNKEVIGLPTFEELLQQCDADGDGLIDVEESKSNPSVLSRPDADGQGDHPLRIFFRMMDSNKDGKIQPDEYPQLKAWVDSFEHANGFVALRPDDTNSVPELAWKQAMGVPECPSPILFDGKLLAVLNGGVVTCLELETGKRLFQKRIAPGGPYYSAPVMGDNKIYLASQRGQLTILSANEQPSVLATADLGESIHATPALASGHLIVRSQNHLWVFDKSPVEN